MAEMSFHLWLWDHNILKCSLTHWFSSVSLSLLKSLSCWFSPCTPPRVCLCSSLSLLCAIVPRWACKAFWDTSGANVGLCSDWNTICTVWDSHNEPCNTVSGTFYSMCKCVNDDGFPSFLMVCMCWYSHPNSASLSALLSLWRVLISMHSFISAM